MADSLTVSAFLTYAQAALKENGSGVPEVSSMKDAISGEVLGCMFGMSITDLQYEPLQLLKITYHRILTENPSAYLLPCPDMGQLKPEDPHASEFIKLYTLILLSQAVWSEANEHYVKVIQGLEEKYQECLKEIIERALAGLAEDQLSGSGEEEREDTVLPEAELCYRLAKKASDIESQFNHVQQGNIKLSSVYADAFQKSSNGTKQSTTPIHEGFNFTIGESESDTESEIIDSRTEGASSKTPARVSDRIKELEIERLSSDLDEKVDELKQLETQLEESRQNVDIYLRRIAELESQVAEIDRLRVDVEIHRHASEKLRKCENVVDKLRKKLDSASDARSEILSLQKQIKTLTEENADWESKYTELFRSRELHKSTPSSVGKSESESQLSELLGRIGQLELALQNKEAEVVQLKEITVRREERDVDEAPHYASSEEEQGSVQKPKTKARPLSSSLRLPESPTQGLGTPREVIAQNKSVSQRPLERTDKLETQLGEVESDPQRLSAAEKYHAEKEPVTSGNLSSAAQNGGSEEITKLQDEVTGLQQALAEAERRYRAEKLLMLRAWTELGQRTMKMGVGVNANGGSTGNDNEGMELGRPVGLSWASRVRQRVHAVPNTT